MARPKQQRADLVRRVIHIPPEDDQRVVDYAARSYVSATDLIRRALHLGLREIEQAGLMLIEPRNKPKKSV